MFKRLVRGRDFRSLNFVQIESGLERNDSVKLHNLPLTDQSTSSVERQNEHLELLYGTGMVEEAFERHCLVLFGF